MDYTDGPETAAPTTDKADAESEMEDSADDSDTALLPKTFFGSKELVVGKECKVKIERIMPEEVQVKYVPHGTDEETPAEDAGEAPGAEKDEMMADAY